MCQCQEKQADLEYCDYYSARTWAEWGRGYRSIRLTVKHTGKWNGEQRVGKTSEEENSSQFPGKNSE